MEKDPKKRASLEYIIKILENIKIKNKEDIIILKKNTNYNDYIF